MPLPQKAIEQLSREPVKTPGWSFQILMVSGTVFFLSLMIYGGLLVGYKPFFERQLTSVKKQIDAFSQQISGEDQEKIIVFYSQLSNLNNILKSQPETSRVFAWLQGNTHGNVVYTKFTLDVRDRKLLLSGEARTVEDLSEQLKVFEVLRDGAGGSRDLASIAFTGTSFREGKSGAPGGWPFNVTLTFRPEFFRSQNQGASQDQEE